MVRRGQRVRAQRAPDDKLRAVSNHETPVCPSFETAAFRLP